MVAAASTSDSAATPDIEAVRTVLATVHDPEIPVITIEELGVLRDVAVMDDEVVVTITPTYSGCPAMDVIAQDIRKALDDSGFTRVQIRSVLAPAWSSEWISESGRRKLSAYGIAPPQPRGGPQACPQCAGQSLERVSEFGSTPCKALYRCRDCLEPFDYFKCI